jgi:uncharacterized protein (DUF433 family)
MIELYGKTDPRDIHAYTIKDAPKYLRIPSETINSWVRGRNYPTANGVNFFKPLILTQELKPTLLSFTNLMEIHVVRAIRKDYKIQLDNVRKALDYIYEEFQVPHPLAREEFRTDGVDLFIEKYGSLINASKPGQTDLKDALSTHLERIELDPTGLAIKLYPFTRSHEGDNPRIFVIDPRIAFGCLVIADTGITISVLAERHHGGDSTDDLADDYECDRSIIEEAIRCEYLPTA